ncbi:hypothetical protein [Actibacterium sp. XHP0104]|uniref:hypothetical protein n=1 Tax=Actibacterium sp. XHP0104 TaxID=2984335 RepID=UPI0021E91F3B|nr:hypothetical protein [Actibacterium sp. XHP0104]MCV2881469.1 hypothetical protein [Actibacterium sp. XHP0104]
MTRALSALAGLIFSAVALATPAMAEIRLVMFEQAGCAYCIMWDKEIGPIYPKTPEGAAAPLQKQDLHTALPDDITLTRGKPRFTPTFVLLRDGTEVERLEGYPGEDFFWGLLGMMLDRSGVALEPPQGEVKG